MKQLLFSVLGLLVGTSVRAHAQQTGPAIRLQADAVIALPPGAGLAAIADGDFNHDNRRDLAVCERKLGQVALYMRSAAGTYPTAKFTYDVGQGPSGLVVFNHLPGRYHASLMAVSGPSSQWTMLRDDQDTTGNLVQTTYPLSFGVPDISSRPELVQADVDQDGNADFAYTYPIKGTESFIRYSRYNSSGGPPGPARPFYTRQLDTDFNASSSLTLADFNRDGFLDQAWTDSTNSAVHVVHSFQREVNVLQTSGRGPVHTAAQDIDGDQLPDLAVAYATSKEVMVLRTTIMSDFTRSYSYQLAASPRRVLLADLNGDSLPELLVVTADNQLLVYQHNGSQSALCYATITPQVLATGVDPSLLQIAYLDADSYPDVVVGCRGDNTVRTYLNRSSTVVTASQASQLLAGVDVYPTLATDQVTVRQAAPRALQATLLDELGRPVRQQLLTESTSILSTASLPRGLYLLRLVSTAGTRVTRVVLQ
ncbi:hypothetical protein GCM10027422_46990 [Hymenobacter arcticus]